MGCVGLEPWFVTVGPRCHKVKKPVFVEHAVDRAPSLLLATASLDTYRRSDDSLDHSRDWLQLRVTVCFTDPFAKSRASLIRRGPIDALDEDDMHRSACGFQPEAELFLDRGEDA